MLSGDESDLQLLARGASIQKNILRPLVSGKKKQSQEVLKVGKYIGYWPLTLSTCCAKCADIHTHLNC